MGKNDIFSEAKQLFSRGFRWTMTGSVIFEISHIVHHSLLLLAFGSHVYGMLGSIFSLLYVTAEIAAFGFGDTLPPFLPTFIRSKNHFKKLFLPYVLPQIPILFGGAYIAFYLYTHKISTAAIYSISFALFSALLVLEGMRMFMRRFLHNVFLNKQTVTIEMTTMFAYLAALWIPYYLFNVPLTFNRVFGYFLINSILTHICFFVLTMQYYKRLSNFAEATSDKPDRYFWPRIIKTRILTYIVNVGKSLMSGNFLVPFFATQFGLRQAGLFKIASIVAHSIKALIKSAIHFSGDALLVKLKTQTIQSKIQAFSILSEKLIQIIYFIAIFLTVNYRVLIKIKGMQTAAHSALFYLIFFLIITLIHQLFVVYEQFYIIEEAAGKLCLIKFFEFALFYGLIMVNTWVTPKTVLAGIVLIQIISFSVMTLHAYRKWKITPRFSVTIKYLISVVAVSFFISLVLPSLKQLIQ